MAAKKTTITAEYTVDILNRIAQGETPQKETAISPKEFIGQVLPHAKIFLAQGYEYKEVAKFIGHVSASDLRKAVKKSLAEEKEREKAVKKEKKKMQKKEKTVALKSVGTKSAAKRAQAGNAAS